MAIPIPLNGMAKKIFLFILRRSIASILKVEYFNSRNEAIIQYWDSDEQDGSLGVYFSTLTVGNYLQARHEDRYIKGAVDNQIDFVCDSKGYVPTVGKNQSLLDKLFYFNW